MLFIVVEKAVLWCMFSYVFMLYVLCFFLFRGGGGEILFYSRLIHSALGLHKTLHIQKYLGGFSAGGKKNRGKWHRKMKIPTFTREQQKHAERLKKKQAKRSGGGKVGGLWLCATHIIKRKDRKAWKLCLIKPLCLYFFICFGGGDGWFKWVVKRFIIE